MAVRSAGLLLYRRTHASALDVWIAHMGGPFWATKQLRAWSIPKGEYGADEDPFAAAVREFTEEIGSPPPAADYRSLGEFRQPSGKVIAVFFGEAEFAPNEVRSNTFELEWPKGSGRMQSFPEIDRAEWVAESEARKLLVAGQMPILDALVRSVGD
ncbi:NUDIX domain-containing protein [Sinomonas albida]|uniref:NUDIX domain-containing protein n=1 Tax=Sinomonas albida TaxID=369942 RepID=UPI0010A7D4CC|nr:NUDIX domain-containing protein [Sinomonas albida]